MFLVFEYEYMNISSLPNYRSSYGLDCDVFVSNFATNAHKKISVTCLRLRNHLIQANTKRGVSITAEIYID